MVAMTRAAVLALLVACGHDPDPRPISNAGATSITDSVVVYGTVLDYRFHAVEGATVRSGETSTKTDRAGRFKMNVPRRAHVSVGKDDMFGSITLTGDAAEQFVQIKMMQGPM